LARCSLELSPALRSALASACSSRDTGATGRTLSGSGSAWALCSLEQWAVTSSGDSFTILLKTRSSPAVGGECTDGYSHRVVELAPNVSGEAVGRARLLSRSWM